MIMSFEEANIIIGGDYHDEGFLEAVRNFGIVTTSICKDCIHRKNCSVKRAGVCECNYFDRGE